MFFYLSSRMGRLYFFIFLLGIVPHLVANMMPTNEILLMVSDDVDMPGHPNLASAATLDMTDRIKDSFKCEFNSKSPDGCERKETSFLQMSNQYQTRISTRLLNASLNLNQINRIVSRIHLNISNSTNKLVFIISNSKLLTWFSLAFSAYPNTAVIVLDINKMGSFFEASAISLSKKQKVFGCHNFIYFKSLNIYNNLIGFRHAKSIELYKS